jgi:hypothetical protein
MILTDKIEIKIFGSNINHYKSVGLIDIKFGDIILIDVSLLPKKSNLKVMISCDICNQEKECIYSAYNRYLQNSPDGIYRCTKCNGCIRKKTLKEKYGDEKYTNVEKYKKTMLDRYGGHCNKLPEFKNKIKNTFSERYGVDYPMQSEFFKKKYIKTINEKYGVEFPLLNSKIREKSKHTMINRYGYEYSMQIDSIKNKIVKSSKKSKIENIKKKNIEIVDIDYENNIYICFCDNCQSEYEISPHVFNLRKKYKTKICTNCNSIKNKYSGHEITLYEYISNIYKGKITRSYRDGLEIDIYLPELNLGFEFNGLYWHSEEYKDKNYHLDKTKYFENKGIRIIHIWEDDWILKQDIVKSIISNKLGNSERIFARKCQVKEINNNKLVRDFLNKNHIQGFVGSKLKLGLFYDDRLLSIMTFGKLRRALGQISTETTNVYELLRFCNEINTSVIGGASKLFKYFINNYKPSEVVSYSDNSRSNGDMYRKLKFNFIHKTKPNYHWIIDGIRRHRFNYRKDKLITEGHDPNQTEIEIMYNMGYRRIFDCGSDKFIYKI